MHQRRATILAFAVGALFATFAAIESCGSPTPETVSSVSDGQHLDSGRDVFSYPLDGSGDGSSSPKTPMNGFTDGWTHVSWASQCALYQPSALSQVPPLNWIACRSGRSGCQELATDWAGSSASADSVSILSQVGSVLLMLRRQYSPYQLEYVIWDSLAGVQAAWRYNGDAKDCLQVNGDISSGSAVMTEAIRNGSSFPSYLQVIGTPTELLAKSQPDYSFTPTEIGFYPSILMSEGSASPTVATMYFGQIDQMSIRDRVSGAVQPVTGSGAGGRAVVAPSAPIVGNTVFFVDTTEGVKAWTPSGVNTLVPSSVSLFAHDVASDGSSLAWIQSTLQNPDGSFGAAAIYASPFATSAGALSPVKLRSLSCSHSVCPMVMGDGYITAAVDSANPGASSFLVLRKADNTTWLLTNNEIWDIGHVAANEIWIPVTRSQSTVERVSVASLGTPLADN